MATDVPITHKKCATCRWWSGKRKVIFVGRDPKFIRIEGVLPAVPGMAENSAVPAPVSAGQSGRSCDRFVST